MFSESTQSEKLENITVPGQFEIKNILVQPLPNICATRLAKVVLNACYPHTVAHFKVFKLILGK
jgi:hypothetical protein